jgi:MscS family membrane protein
MVLASFIAWTALLCVPASVAAATPELNPLEPPDTSSPRATLQTFLETMQEASRIYPALLEQYRSEPGLSFSPSAQREFDRMALLMERAAECLDVSDVPPRLTAKVTVESTLLLKEIFDRVELPALEAAPDAEAAAAAGLDRWRIPHTEIVIAKVKDGDRAGEFLFSPGTVRRLPEFYEKVRALPYKPGSWKGLYDFFTTIGSQRYIPWKLTAGLPAWAKAPVWDQALWRWIVLGAAFLAGSAVLIAITRRIGHPSAAPVLRQYLRRLVLPVSLGILAQFLSFVVHATNLTGTPRNVIATFVGVLWLLSAAWAILLLAGMAGEAIAGAPRLRARAIDQAIARLGSRVLGFLFAVGVVMYGAQLLGAPVTPLLGALGVGSLAVALAAQPTIENFIAGITLYADRPVRVGDFCRFGDTVGTVENIGMRSTHIRTLDDTVVSVPNGEFSKARLENFTRRRSVSR